MPIGTPISVAKKRATIPNSKVAGKRSMNSDQTELLETIDVPRLP